MRRFGEAKLVSHVTVVKTEHLLSFGQVHYKTIFLVFSVSVLILPLLLVLLYVLHLNFVQSHPYGVVFQICDKNNVDNTSEL